MNVEKPLIFDFTGFSHGIDRDSGPVARKPEFGQDGTGISGIKKTVIPILSRYRPLIRKIFHPSNQISAETTAKWAI